MKFHVQYQRRLYGRELGHVQGRDIEARNYQEALKKGEKIAKRVNAVLVEVTHEEEE